MDESTREVLEIVRFSVTPGTSPAQVREQAVALGPWLRRCLGFVGRTLAGPDAAGRYTDVVRWRSAEAARAAAAQIMAEPSAAPFMALIEPEGLTMEHLDLMVAQPTP